MRTEADAQLIVLPLMLGVEAADMCSYSSAAAFDATRNTSTWRERQRDHVLLATNWRVSAGRLPYRTTRLPSNELVWAHYEAYSRDYDLRRARNDWERQLISDRAQVAHMLAAPYTEHRTAYSLEDGPTRDVRFFFGGYTSSLHKGCACSGRSCDATVA